MTIIGSPGKTRTIKIFLASSSELKDDREKFENFICRKVKELKKRRIFLELVIWEDFNDAMSQTRKQDDYNENSCEKEVSGKTFYRKGGKVER